MKYPARLKLPYLTLILITPIIMIVASTDLSAAYIQHAYSIRSTAPSPTPCNTYNPSTRAITVSCGSTTLTDIYNHFHGNNILSKQSSAGVWLLNAKLVIGKGATLNIDSTDTKWLKISSSGGTTVSGASAIPNSIDVHGTLKVDSVKITSWNSLTNNYANTNGTRHDLGVGKTDATVSGAPRPFITVEKDATGTTDIINSEIAYLGYEKGSFSGTGTAGLNYYGGDGSVLLGNNIHHLYFGFYSSGVGRMVIENNQVHHNTIYGLDPHTATHDMIIRKNVVHDNGQFGIICSLNCNNITIENNEIYHDGNKNTGAGIMFSRNMVNSIARNNIVHDEVSSAISISESHNNQVYNNTISNSGSGINLKNSTNIKIYDNTIINSSKGIVTSATSGVASNMIYNNHFINTPSSSSSSPHSSNNVGPQPQGTLKHQQKHSSSGHKAKPGFA
ncbi:MAG TPA: NosD domain-containing protein [Candidatus Nitrosopolaris sp.]|nr:NosD domain-containing protein [Candidatus Nitrosopolaris sp.]